MLTFSIGNHASKLIYLQVLGLEMSWNGSLNRPASVARRLCHLLRTRLMGASKQLHWNFCFGIISTSFIQLNTIESVQLSDFHIPRKCWWAYICKFGGWNLHKSIVSWRGFSSYNFGRVQSDRVACWLNSESTNDQAFIQYFYFSLR